MKAAINPKNDEALMATSELAPFVGTGGLVVAVPLPTALVVVCLAEVVELVVAEVVVLFTNLVEVDAFVFV